MASSPLHAGQPKGWKPGWAIFGWCPFQTFLGSKTKNRHLPKKIAIRILNLRWWRGKHTLRKHRVIRDLDLGRKLAKLIGFVWQGRLSKAMLASLMGIQMSPCKIGDATQIGGLGFLGKVGGPPSKSLEAAQGTKSIPVQQLWSLWRGFCCTADFPKPPTRIESPLAVGLMIFGMFRKTSNADWAETKLNDKWCFFVNNPTGLFPTIWSIFTFSGE